MDAETNLARWCGSIELTANPMPSRDQRRGPDLYDPDLDRHVVTEDLSERGPVDP